MAFLRRSFTRGAAKATCSLRPTICKRLLLKTTAEARAKPLPIMFSSMRAQLTLWYTGVLALVLVVFAFATYAYLARAARERTDQSLADTANSLVSNFAAESNDEDQSDTDAAAEVTRNFQFKDRQVIIFDER